ncbi:perlucin-like protein [Haliotis rubra]|uniref:perlucin-like protein n=1 Tax=Haliotis rubra TaxID=36100 RepID=UPI001EE5C415|nr:perlucin-like protein [Haliotis rubra]
MKWIVLIEIYIVYSNGALAAGVCKGTWDSYEGSCYAYVNDQETWAGAAEICERLGGYLVEITSSTENNYVKQLIRSSSAGDVWTGGNDLLGLGKWSWLNSGNRILFTDWAPGEPHGSSVTRCIQLWADDSYLWDDTPCHEENAFVCESGPLSDGSGVTGEVPDFG